LTAANAVPVLEILECLLEALFDLFRS
jgi:hypothetical protein